MSLLKDKKILLTGVLSNRSIAYGIAKACHREGAQLAFTYQNERFLDRITGFAKEFDSEIVLPLDVADDAQIFALAETLKTTWGGLDGVVHSIGFAPREAIQGDFLEGLSRDAFKTALDISAYSFPALIKALVPLMEGHPSSLCRTTTPWVSPRPLLKLLFAILPTASDPKAFGQMQFPPVRSRL